MITATPRGGTCARFLDDRFGEVSKSGPDLASSSLGLQTPRSALSGGATGWSCHMLTEAGLPVLSQYCHGWRLAEQEVAATVGRLPAVTLQ